MKRLASALDAARRARSRLRKEDAIAGALRAIADDGDDLALATAARIAVGATLPIGDGRSLGVGWSLLFETACALTGWSPEIAGACARRTGDLGEAFALLAARDERATERPGVPLRDVARLFDAVASTSARADKRRLLDDAFGRATPLETKYLAKAILGELRVGAQGGVFEAAVAKAFDAPLDDVRRAAALVTDAGDLAVLAKHRRLDGARLELGRPVAFMLATPIESIAGAIDYARYVAEDKIDGVRAQLHKKDGAVAIFARGLDRITGAFPEIEAALARAHGDVALDGEIVVVGEAGRPRPFQSLQPRLRKTAPTPEIIESSPAAFIAYDLLADDGGDALPLRWTERRARLEAYARANPGAFLLNAYRPLAAPYERAIEAEFEAARARGNEGVVLKRVDAPYEAGKRGQAWIKVKKAYATLDVVVTAAEQGHGKRAGVLSDYTFGVWRGDEIVNVGKAYSGLTDAEIEALQARIERLTIERRGGVRLVTPEIVLEVAFDGVQRSTRHASGYALRFPRIARIRDDKRPEQADTLDAVEALYRAQLASGHREDAPEKKPTQKKPKTASKQLSLFGDEPPKKS